MIKKTTKQLKKFEGKGVVFSVSHLIEIFPSPLPKFNEHEIEICSEVDLFRMSRQEGFNELFLNNSDVVMGESEGELYEFSLRDFIEWQLERMNTLTIYHLIGKTEAPVDNILDRDVEYKKDSDHNPEDWLNVYQSEKYLDKGLSYIERLKKEVPDAFYKVLIDAILDDAYGLLNIDWYETELEGNIDQIRKAYAHWKVPLMVVSTGKFSPYIEKNLTANLLMDDYNLQRMYIRNYDEGDKL
jgi:hypothetical protein